MATAETIARQVEASGGARIQFTRQVIERPADALEKSGVEIVPRISIQAGGTDGAGAMGGGGLKALPGMLLSEKGGALLEKLDVDPDQAGQDAKQIA